MDERHREPDNPYTFLEGYRLLDVAGFEAGKVEAAIYDAPTDVLKYLIVEGHAVPADRIVVDAAEEVVSVPYPRETMESAPALEELSGAFDDALREHYEKNG